MTYLKSEAIINVCYRYSLIRTWEDISVNGYAMFIGLNPSTADATEDDPTIRRCVNFAKDWGYSGLVMTNLFAFRATMPKVMKAQTYPVGELNNHYLLWYANHAKVIVAAWGKDGGFLNRDCEVKRLIPNLHYLKLNKDGTPAHPLYLKGDSKPILWEY